MSLHPTANRLKETVHAAQTIRRKFHIRRPEPPLGLAGPASAGKLVPFKGRIDGTFTITPNPVTLIVTFAGEGTGNATHLGRFSYTFPHVVNFGSVPPIGIGTYTFTAANGDTLTAHFVGQSSPVAPGIVDVVENGTIAGGRGRFTNATGSFVIKRRVDQVNRTTTGTFNGSVSSPASN